MANPNDLKIALAGDKNLIAADLILADLRNADLTDADLTDADLRNSILTNADLTDAVLMNADLARADLTNAKLNGADLEDADFTDAILRDADLTDAILRDAKLEGADFTGAKLSVRQIYNLGGTLTLEQKMSLHGSTSMKKGDILSSKTNPETYRVISIGSRGGKTIVNIVNTKNKKRYSKRVYQEIKGPRVTLYVKNRAGDVFTSR